MKPTGARLKRLTGNIPFPSAGLLLAAFLLAFAPNVFAQGGAKALTVTLVRWPYT